MSEGITLKFFQESGFIRQTCSKCKCHFWSLVESELCGDAPCVEYSFIGKPLFPKPMNLDEAREAFLRFFEKNKHTRVDRASVVARWRNDIYLSIASIAVFQPHVTSGSSNPPANPLTISQPCIRLNDLESVGRSGRHLTTFEMMAHHAFNDDEKTYYWQNDTVRYCHEFYTELGLDGSKITYKENPWVGGGNGGEALEVLAGGLELATLVFMDLEEDPEGEIELKGIKFKRMPRSIVDTGYGLERLVWASQGTSTIYESVFPDAVSFLTKEANLVEKLKSSGALISENAKLCGVLSVDYGSDLTKLRNMVLDRLNSQGYDLSLPEFISTIEPLEKLFAIVDHSRALAFMFGDGIVPSNVKAGYLARMVLRRTVLLSKDINVPNILPKMVKHHIDNFSETYTELKQIVSFRFQNMDYKEAMTLMSKIGGINILVGDDVAGAISAELVNVPWDKAFNALLDMKNYAADIDVASNIIRVSTPATLTSQESYKSARALAVKKKVELEDSVEPIISEIFRLYYISPQEAKATITELFKSTSGTGSSFIPIQVTEEKTTRSIIFDGLFSLKFITLFKALIIEICALSPCTIASLKEI